MCVCVFCDSALAWIVLDAFVQLLPEGWDYRVGDVCWLCNAEMSPTSRRWVLISLEVGVGCVGGVGGG